MLKHIRGCISSFKDLECSFFILQKGMSMNMEKQICGNCKWSKQEVPFGEYYCENPDADAYGCENTYTDSCPDFEYERED